MSDKESCLTFIRYEALNIGPFRLVPVFSLGDLSSRARGLIIEYREAVDMATMELTD